MRYVIYKDNNYHFRIRIPHMMKEYFKYKTFYTKSMRTKKKLEAVSYSKILYKKFEFIKYCIEMQMDKNKILALVDDFISVMFNDTEESLYNINNPEDTLFYLSLEDTIKTYQDHFNKNDYSLIQEAIENITSKLDYIPKEEEYNLIAKELLKNYINSFKILQDNIEQGIYKKSKPTVQPSNGILNNQTSNNITKQTAKDIYKLDEKYEQYRSHNIKQWSDDDISNNNVMQYLLNLFFGVSYNISDITQEQILDFVNIFYDIPNRVTLRKELQDKSLEYILDHSEEYDNLSIRTINKYNTTLNRFFEYCKKLNYTSLDVKIKKINDKSITLSRVAYENEDLELIKDHLDTIEPLNALVIKIALYSGLRLGEITQLRAKDIKLDDTLKIYYFDINTEDNKKVKNKTSIRKVPLHPKLAKLIHDQIKNLQPTQNIFTLDSAEFSKWYRLKFNRKYITTDKRKVFHSFRHNAVTNMLQNGISLEYIAGAVGHAQDLGMTFKYAGNVIPLDKLKDAIYSIDYKIDFFS